MKGGMQLKGVEGGVLQSWDVLGRGGEEAGVMRGCVM